MSVSESLQLFNWRLLAYNEEILTLQTGNILVSTLNALGDLTLVLVAENGWRLVWRNRNGDDRNQWQLRT
jgi:hypothetical protein